MLYQELKEQLANAKQANDRAAVADIIGVIDAVDKKVFAEKKRVGSDFIIQDSVVLAVLKNQIKNTKAAYEQGLSLVGVTTDTEYLASTVELLTHFLPPAVEGDDLRMVIQGLGATNMGHAMGLLKAQSIEQGYDYDGKEASIIAKEIFV